MFMVQNNQTSVWYRFRLRSQMTLTGTQASKWAKQGGCPTTNSNLYNRAEWTKKQVCLIDRFKDDEIYTSWGTSRMARDPSELVWQGTTYNKFNTICAILPATLLYKQFHKTFHSKRCQGFAFHLMILANLKGEIQIKSRRSTSHISKRTQRVSNKLFEGTRK